VSARGKEELIGIGALAIGLFLGLTLLPVAVTGPWGRTVGVGLLKAFGAGAWLLPVLGIGWALAAFERLGRLSVRGAALLGAGLMVLIPYGVGVVAGASAVSFPPDYLQWTPLQKIVGILPGFLASAVRGVVGTAGGVLVGIVALSAVGIVSVGWHPFVMLRSRADDEAKGKGEGGRGKGEGSVPAHGGHRGRG
jgi:hypothetical protein